MKENKINYDASLDAKMEERSKVEHLRDSSELVEVNNKKVSKISGYKFKILVRDKNPLEGNLTREELDLICRLYVSDGTNLSQREVSRYFPLYTFQEFKKILRAFNITKASSPFAPHMLEEKTTEELIQLSLQRKENDYLKKYELQKEKLHETRYRELLKDHSELKQGIANFKEFLSTLNIEVNLDIVKPEKDTDVAIVLYLSDMHIGAEVSNYSIYDNNFNKEEVQKRMRKIIEEILRNAQTIGATKLVICNLGDSLDGYNGQTTRAGHILPQNMNNKDQYKTFISSMLYLIGNFANSGVFNEIKYYCVEGGNHDGDVGFIANQALIASLNILNPEIEAVVFEKFLDYFTLFGNTFILTHGKDAKDMFKNMPLTINDKTENQLNEFIDYVGLSGKIHVIKGDLHQSATTYAKKFRYKSVGSFFGSSEWIHKNFGNTKAVLDYDVVTPNSIFESRILLN
jgi:hypothetical protein